MTVGLSYVRRLVKMATSVDETDDPDLENMFNMLLDNIKREVKNAFDYISNNHGWVGIERRMYHQKIEPETILGVEFKTANKKAPEADTASETPEV